MKYHLFCMFKKHKFILWHLKAAVTLWQLDTLPAHVLPHMNSQNLLVFW